MEPAVALTNRRTLLDRIDAKSVFGVYAFIAGVTGVSIAGTGIRGLPGTSLAHSSLIWISGMADQAGRAVIVRVDWSVPTRTDPAPTSRRRPRA